MDSVGLDCAGNVGKILVDHGHERNMMPRGEVLKHRIKLTDVVRAIVGWKGDAGKQDFDVGIGERGEHGVEIVKRLVEGKTA